MPPIRKALRVLSLVVLSSIVSQPAHAQHDVQIRIDSDGRLRPRVLEGLSTDPSDPARSHPIVWHNDDNVAHDFFFPREVLFYALPDRVRPGGSSDPLELEYASSYPYLCQIHPAMGGSLNVRPALFEPGSPGDYAVTNRPQDSAILRLANVPLPENFVFDVERRLGHGAWTRIATSLMRPKLAVSPNAPGEYRFRVRLRHYRSGDSLDWVWSKKLTVDEAA